MQIHVDPIVIPTKKIKKH